jgi:hypothetical protein
MPTYVDDIAVTFQGQTLGEVVKEAQDRATPVGRVVVEVSVDGEPLIGDQLTARDGDPVVDGEIKIITAEPTELLLDTLVMTRGKLDEVIQFQQQAADCLQRDESTQGMEALNKAIDIWLMVQQAVEQSAMMQQIPFSELTAGELSFEQLVKQLIDQLESLKVALIARDTVAVADTLEYEWPAMTEQWRTVIDALMSKIQAGTANS